MADKTLRRNAPTSLNVKELHNLIDHIEDYDLKIYKAAVWYAKQGIFIVPFMPYGYPKGLSQRHASKSIDKINEWWHPETGLFPGASIAMAHGGQSGYCAIDLDTKKADGIQALADLQAAYGKYNDQEGEDLQTLMALTPSGGRHLIFKFHPEIISNSEVTIAGIDARGGYKANPLENGGITFVEPSRKPTEDGDKYYRWDESVTQIIDMPQWLVDIMCGRRPAQRTGIVLQDQYIQSAPGKHGDGRDRNIYMDLMAFVGIGYTEEQLWGLMPEILKRMDPPDEAMVRRKIESAVNSQAFKNAQDEKVQRDQTDTLKLAKDDKGRVKPTINNLRVILMSPLFEVNFGLIEYDDFYQRFAINKEPISMVADYSVGIQLWIAEKFGIAPGANIIRQTVEYLAYKERPHSNAAKDYMLNCPVPSEPRDNNYWGSGRKGPGPAFKRLCTEVLQFGKNLHPNYNDDVAKAYEAFLWFWMQGIVARACVPGCKMEIMLNIFGAQGIGKSTFFRDLCPNPAWFTDSIQDTIVSSGQDNKDELSKLRSKIIVEMPELSPVKKGGKAADDKIKSFLSAQVDEYRRSYGIDVVEHPRTCAFGGTANNNDVYRDLTGDRRFVSINHGDTPILVGDLDRGVMAEIRDRVWGELVSSFNPGELEKSRNHLIVVIPPTLRDPQSAMNSAHRYEEIGLSDVVEWMQDKTRVTWDEIVAYARSVAGLRDAKESHIMLLVRQTLNNDGVFQFKKRIMRTSPAGVIEKVNCWVNTELDVEKNHKAGMPTPKHWSENKDAEY